MVVGKVAAAVLVAVAAAAAIALVAVLSYYGGIFGNHVQANYQKRVVTSQVQQRVRTAQFAQAVYEQFFNDCHAVVAANAQIQQAQERIAEIKQQPDDAFGQKGQRLTNAETDLTGLEQSQSAIAERYNANAQEYTRGQFLDATLPPAINPPYTHLDCGGSQ